MENDNFSKATTLFNFMLKRFETSKAIGELQFLDVLEMVRAIEQEKFPSTTIMIGAAND